MGYLCDVIDAPLVAQSLTEQRMRERQGQRCAARGGFAYRPQFASADDDATCRGKE